MVEIFSIDNYGEILNASVTQIILEIRLKISMSQSVKMSDFLYNHKNCKTKIYLGDKGLKKWLYYHYKIE